MKKMLAISLLVCFTFSITTVMVQAEDIIIYKEPIVESFDLLQTGSLANPYITNITADFDIVTKMNWILNFVDISMDWNSFGAGSSLSNGIYIGYSINGNMIGNNITNNHELMALAYNAHYFQDDQNPASNIIWIQHLLTSFIDGGIIIDNNHQINIYIQDDLNDASYAITSFIVTFKGYKITQEQIFNPEEPRNDPLDVLGLFWRDNGPTLEGLAISLIGFVIVLVFWRRRS